jgi:adenylate cyclase
MGATTWSYPKATVSLQEYMEIVATVRQGFRDAYSEYMKEVETFTNKPAIGEGWPKDGFHLPSVEVFMAEHERRASAATVGRLLTNATAAPR